MVIWLTGLSGSGKTTIARCLCDQMRQAGERCELLDGDELREGICRELGFSRSEREENVRRIAWLASLLERNDVIVLVAVIAPYREQRSALRHRFQEMLEVFVDAPLEVCERRDPKLLYARARNGEIRNFTGIDDVYEGPEFPDVHCMTDRETLSESSAKVMRAIENAPAHAIRTAASVGLSL